MVAERGVLGGVSLAHGFGMKIAHSGCIALTLANVAMQRTIFFNGLVSDQLLFPNCSRKNHNVPLLSLHSNATFFKEFRHLGRALPGNCL